MTEASGIRGLVKHPEFVRLWIADGLSNLGIFTFSIAAQFLMIDVLHANQVEIGVVRSAQWLPYLVFGLITGVVIDRVRRKRLLVGTDIASSVIIFLIAGLAIGGPLSMPVLTVLVFALGSVSVLNSGAHQSFVADLLPPRLLTSGNVALTQTYTAAQTAGPIIGGALVRVIGAPFAMVANGFTYAISALLLSRVPDMDHERAPTRRSIIGDLREGIGYVYRHRTLAPYALTLHTWFVGNSIVGTIYVFHATGLGLDSTAVGVTLACAGVSGVLGAALAERAAKWLGLGMVAVGADFITGAGWFVVALAPDGALAFWMLCAAQLLYGFGLGIRGPLEMSYRNAVTPSELRGRMNTTIRSFNWGLIAVAAPLGGWLAFIFSNQLALTVGGAIIIASGIALALSPYRLARMPEESAEAEPGKV